MASNTLIMMARLSMLAFFPIYIMETLNYSAFVLGIYLFVLHITGIFQFGTGILSDHIGRKMVLVPSFTLMSILYIAIAFVPAGIPLGIVIGALGIFFYPILNLTQTAIMDVAPKEVQASTTGILALVFIPFAIISPMLSGYLVSEFGIESIFWYASIVALTAAAILIPVRFHRTV